MRIYNKRTTPQPMRLANGNVVLVPPKGFVDVDAQQTGSSSMRRAVAKGDLAKLKPQKEHAIPAPVAVVAPTAPTLETPPLPGTVRSAAQAPVSALVERAADVSPPVEAEAAVTERKRDRAKPQPPQS